MTDQPRICPTCGKPFMAGHTSAGTRSGDSPAARTTHAENRADVLAREMVAHVETIANRDKSIQELNGEIAKLQSELRDTRQQLSAARQETNNARPGARKPGMIVSTTRGLAYRDPSRLMIRNIALYLATAIACIAITVALISLLDRHRASLRPTLAQARTTSPEESQNGSSIEVSMGEPISIDGLDVILSNPRVGPVTQVSVLGTEMRSDELYLKIDVVISNRSETTETMLQQPWMNAQIKDNQNRKLRPLPYGQYEGMTEVKGRIITHIIKPGETVTDVLVFPWNDSDADRFTLIADPDIRQMNAEERIVQMSLQTLRVSFERSAIARQ